MRRSATLALVVLCLAARGAADEPDRDLVTLSIVGTTDLHGYVFARDGNGGLALLGGYLRNLRAARAADGGAVLLVDTGDTFQAGIESNLSEGALVVDAYAALGYDALVVGNHEFDFGPVDSSGARQSLGADPLGALKAAAARAKFPFLAANLVDAGTGLPIDWRNVHRSVLVEAAGVKVGIVGVMSIDALRATLPVHVQGLRVTPLAAAIAAEAAQLRAAGARVVVVGSHAGGACAEFRDPQDLSSCDSSAEMFTVARALPPGLVDVIVAGHTHQGVAHEVAGVAIVQGYAQGRAFGRVDVTFDRRTQRVVRHEILAPRDVCAAADPASLACAQRADSSIAFPPARYEGLDVVPDTAVVEAMAPALARVHELQAAPLGVVLDTPIPRAGDEESPLGNLFADAQRARTGADVAINNNVRGGLRADLPAGALTFGRLYAAFPFDNRVVTVTLTGAELRALVADELRRNRPAALAISGARVRTSCTADGELEIDLRRASGEPIGADEGLAVAAMDSLVAGAVFASVRPAGGFGVPPADTPVMREVVEDWLREHGGHLDTGRFVDPSGPRWQYPADSSPCLEPSTG
jgi:2',3'-cyclic-nucleotide 2'-phosphodiesterase (5'-nucleotidase family)